MRYSYLDSLKGWAILGVILFHTTSFSNMPLPAKMQWIVAMGARGVQLFFVLSAVSLSYSWYRQSQTSLRSFYTKRFTTIAIPYYASLLYWIIISGISVSAGDVVLVGSFLNAWWPPLFNTIFPGSWFIPVLVSFYVMFPWIIRIFKDVPIGLALVLVSMLVSQFIRLWLLPSLTPGWYDFMFLFPLSQLPVFLMGLVTYQLINVKMTHRNWKAVAVFLGIVGFLRIIQVITGVPIVAGHFLYGIGFCGIAMYLAKHPHVFLVNNILTTIGRHSYGLYLIHFIVLFIMTRWHIADIHPEQIMLSFGFRFLTVTSLSILIVYGWSRNYPFTVSKKFGNLKS